MTKVQGIPAQHPCLERTKTKGPLLIENHFKSTLWTLRCNLSQTLSRRILKWKRMLPGLSTTTHYGYWPKMKQSWKNCSSADFFSNAAYTVLPGTPKPLCIIIAKACIHFFNRGARDDCRRLKKNKKWETGEQVVKSCVQVNGLVLYWDKGWANAEKYARSQTVMPTHARFNTQEHGGSQLWPFIMVCRTLMLTESPTRPNLVPLIQ